MKKADNHLISLVIMLSTLVPISAIAETSSPLLDSNEDSKDCRALIRECFTYSDNERTHCFYTAGTHPFCDGTELGKISINRWSMSKNNSQGDAPGFLGPKLVDQDCLLNFDSYWSSIIMDNTSSGDSRKPAIKDGEKALTSKLEGCKVKTSDIFRP